MSDEGIPDLGGEPSANSQQAPKPLSKSQAKRIAAQRGVPVSEVIASGKFEDLDPRPLLKSMQVAAVPAEWPRRHARWRVLEDREIPNGASTFLIQTGQVLSEQHHDVRRCLDHGAKLEKLPD